MVDDNWLLTIGGWQLVGGKRLVAIGWWQAGGGRRRKEERIPQKNKNPHVNVKNVSSLSLKP